MFNVTMIEEAHARFVNHIAAEIVDETRDDHIYVGGDDTTDFQRAQVNLWRWQRRNFGPANGRTLPTLPMYTCGIVEECGESAEAELPIDAEDAFGDVCIYACNCATSLQLDFQTIFYGYKQLTSSDERSLRINMGTLAHAALKAEQRIRGYDDPAKPRLEMGNAMSRIIARLRDAFDASPEVAFFATSQRVTKRDWKKDAIRGVTG